MSESPPNRIDPERVRRPDHPVEPLLVRRWSPRAMSGEPVSPEELLTLFEAARWAPSSFNEQPWRFVHSGRGDASWPGFFGLLMEGNRTWVKNAGALIVVLSRKAFTRNGRPARTHSFDAGAAWQNLALQGTRLGLVVHAMAGFDYDAAASLVRAPEHFAVEAMIAVGRPAPVEVLPERLQAVERPSGRRRVAEFAFPGAFPARE